MSADATVLSLKGVHSESDADLLAAATRRDAAAFGKLVAKYHSLVFRIVWRITNGNAESEDIAQEAFIKLWNNPGQLREAGALKSWLARVAYNLAMDWFRRRPLGADLEQFDVEDQRPTAEENVDRDWATQRINTAVAKLPERQRQVVTLVHFEQFTQVEAARTMELSVDALESLLARARRTLKEHLSQDRQDLMAGLQDKD